MKDSTNHKRKE